MQTSVVGVGMVTALGLDWETSCAASRAGVSRAEAIEEFKIQAGDPWETQSVVGHRASLVTRGFEGYGRFKRLLAAVLSDLVRQGLAPVNECPMYLLLSPLGTEAHERTQGDIQSQDAEGDTLQLGAHIAAAVALAKWPGRIRLEKVSTSAEASFIRLLELPDSANGSGVAIIVVLDSLLEDAQLSSLAGMGRLKTTANPVGLMPGEAAVAFVVASNGKRRATLGPMAFARAEDTAESWKPTSGVRLAQLIENIGTKAGWPGDSTPWILSDQNGEAVRSQVWGSAWQRLCAKQPSFHRAALWYSAASFGDAGCANPAIAAAMALAAWDRGYAPADECCIVTSSQDCERAALMMRRLD